MSAKTKTIMINDAQAPPTKPLRIGVFGGSFNPIHLGHALLAITTQQTKPVDQVVLVPVFKHAVKRDLLPFEHRVAMCRLAVAPFANSTSTNNAGGPSIQVSTIEQRVGASNGAMLKALKDEYPPGTKLFWICGDDFFRWMERPKGLETLKEVSGLIVQRRLHKGGEGEDRFFKEPIDEINVRAVAARLNLTVDFIYGELPHFSSTLVRKAPGHWRSFLPQTVADYLEERPELLQKLIANLEADSIREEKAEQGGKQSTKNKDTDELGKRKRGEPAEMSKPLDEKGLALRDASVWIERGINVVHSLQVERGRSGLWLSLGTDQSKTDANGVQAKTDALLKETLEQDIKGLEKSFSEGSRLDEVLGLAYELRQVPIWLKRDRAILQQRFDSLVHMKGVKGWMTRLALLEKFNPRIDVLMNSLLRALTEIRNCNGAAEEYEGRKKDGDESRDLMPRLLWKWSQAKEALGRERAFVCAGGPQASIIVSQSLEMRQRLNECIQEKDRKIRMVLSFNEQASTMQSAPDALHRMLETLTLLEWTLMRSFASSTPISLVHKLLSNNNTPSGGGGSPSDNRFEVEQFFHASTTAIDFLLTLAKALAAASCAG